MENIPKLINAGKIPRLAIYASNVRFYRLLL